MSTGYECPCMVQSGQLMSGRLRLPPTQSTEFLCLDARSSMVLHMSSIHCRAYLTIWRSVYCGYYDVFVVVEVYFSGSNF